jgi:hypothetical protein
MPVANRNLDYISRHYGVPAEIGGRVEFERQPGTIVGTTGHYLRIKLDREPHPLTFHPTWHLRYVDPLPPKDKP